MSPQELLKQFFGHENFRPGQEEIINSILSGKEVLAVLPTGGGKSICYQIPALLSLNFSIVISPLIALMKDQVDSLNRIGNVSAFINSTLDFRESEKVLNDAANGRIKLLYVSPEKLDTYSFPERIKSLKPDYIFIDEAHCISEWGHNFRPSYRKIKNFIESSGIKSVAAFTATATEDVRNDIIEQLGMENPLVFVKGFERENLAVSVVQTNQKREKLIQLFKKIEQPAIIYTATRKLAEEVCEHLRANNFDSVYYHAGLTAELRRIIQDDFQNGRINIIAATNAFGMGIDKSNIRTVVHYNLPPSIENYYQEIGRAGRDGNDSQTFLFYDENDKQIQEYFIRNSYPSREQVETVYNALCDYGNIALGNVSGKDIPFENGLLQLMGIKEISKALFESSIKILEDSAYVETRKENKNKHAARFLIHPQRLNGYIKTMDDNEIKDLILLLVREYGGSIFGSETSINISKLSGILNDDRERVVNNLNFLNNAGIISYKAPLKVPSFRILQHRQKSDDLKLNFQKSAQLADHNRNKLEQMINFAFAADCRFKYILNYFGEDVKNYKCGKCDNCTGKSLQHDSTDFIEEHILSFINESKISLDKKTLVDGLLGKSRKKELLDLSSYSSLTHYGKKEIESTVANLIARGKIEYVNNSTKLSVLNHDKNILEEPPQKISNKDYESELRLFNILRQIRKEASARFSQLPQLICPDEVLKEICRHKPTAYSDLLSIKGFSQRMLNKIGEDFINAIRDFSAQNDFSDKVKKESLPESIILIYELVQKKYPLEEIAKLAKLPESVVSMQIETLLEYKPNTEIDYLFDKNELEMINKKINEGITDLKELRFATNEKISYAKLRIALTKHKVT
ncbi:MAG: RecQ family ATP-dependent DNA helicase [Ignavibacteriales bacterium]|nr:RecQ family ATP-dependent DNA helicase [Ignavibacteriales bacterium]